MVATLRSRFPLRARFGLIGLILLPFCGVVSGQVPVTTNERTTLAGSVPASTRIFVTVNRLADLDRAVTQARASRLISVLGGKSATNRTFDFKTMIHALVGAGSLIPADDLMKCEVGLAAESFSQLANPVWLVRAADEAMLGRWFPQHTIKDGGHDSARVFRTDDGRFVCIRGTVIALAPRASDWVQLGSVLRAMAGADADVLEKLPAYRESIAYLPSRPVASVYMAGKGSPGIAAGHVAVAVYFKGETIDFALRGSRMEPLGKGSVAPPALERMLRLPQTTLGAYITTVDWEALTGQSNQTAGALPRYLRLVKELGKAESKPGIAIPQLGRHLILAWGQDFSSSTGTTPQLAALLETPDATSITNAADRVALSLGRIISTLELRDVSAEMTIVESRHLGVAISSIPLREFAEKSRFRWVKALASLEPSWAASGDWFVVTLTTDHLHRILDAQFGFLGALADESDARSLRDTTEQSVSAAILQGSLASTTLQQWETMLRAVDAERLMRQLWEGDRAADANGSRLGIELADQVAFGLVEVAAVTPSSPADGRLQAGDLVIAVDGRLLEMVDPDKDLQQWWEEASPGSVHTLRVLRGDSMLELEVTRRHDEVSLSDLFGQPLDVLREISVLFDAIPSATLQIHNTRDDHLSALLRLRLTQND